MSEAHRGKGIAKKLFARLGQIARDRDLARMEWVVLDWNKNAKAVYEKMGAVQVRYYTVLFPQVQPEVASTLTDML